MSAWLTVAIVGMFLLVPWVFNMVRSLAPSDQALDFTVAFLAVLAGMLLSLVTLVLHLFDAARRELVEEVTRFEAEVTRAVGRALFGRKFSSLRAILSLPQTPQKPICYKPICCKLEKDDAGTMNGNRYACTSIFVTKDLGAQVEIRWVRATSVTSAFNVIAKFYNWPQASNDDIADHTAAFESGNFLVLVERE